MNDTIALWPAAKVQTVVPVGSQPQTDPVPTHLLRGKIERSLQMLIDRPFTLIRERNDLVEERHISRLLARIHTPMRRSTARRPNKRFPSRV